MRWCFMDENIIIAWATVATAIATFTLAIITVFISYLTFKAQDKERTIVSLEKKLEKVFSPMEEAVTIFKLDNERLESSNNREIPLGYIEKIFDKLTGKLLQIKRNYGYLIDNEVISFHRDVWIAKKEFDAEPTMEKKNILISRINRFHDIIVKRIDKYNKEIDKLHEIK